MPNPVKYTGNGGMANTLPSSRYAMTPVIIYEGKATYPIYRKRRSPFGPSDRHYEITKDTEFRPDKISHKYYGTPDYWWKIMEMNGMKDILEFRAGRNIILPGGSLMF